jgi:uncharacterized protein (DUF433 family)/DNA-binding transcriptional MerR regulator
MGSVHYLDSGIYTVTDASRLLGISASKVRGWVAGHPGSEAGPIIPTEYDKLGRRIALSFKNLIEALFVKNFADHGISIQSIRVMAEEAKRILNTAHPFATEIMFKTDKKRIFAQIFNDSIKEVQLYDLKKRNWTIESIMRDFLTDAVVYGPEGYAHLWYPRKEQAPHVVVTPTHAFGQPILKDSGVPTETLLDALDAEDGDYIRVAKWYQVSPEDVLEARKFEHLLDRAA